MKHTVANRRAVQPYDRPFPPWRALAAALVWLILPGSPMPHTGLTSQAPDSAPHPAGPDRAEFARYAGSHACASCHRSAYDEWLYSHHARAERPLHPVRDAEAFDPPRQFALSHESFLLRLTNGAFSLTVTASNGAGRTYPVLRALGVRPLVQYLVPAPGGRLQMTPVAHDPVRRDWFHVFGTDERLPGEWGHWTGRGMNWNSMCAQCHNTAVRKNYDPATDRYATTLAERGVGCEACHGPMRDHVLWQQQHPGSMPDPTLPALETRRMFDTCASCHTRRTELTGTFRPGGKFEDHYLPAMVDASETFHPDGQVHDENFEWAAFLGSRMHDAGVRCTDCHNPHTGRVRQTGNPLCLSCHAAGRHPRAPAVDPLTHSHHPPGSPGDQCVQCHMPVTVYMQRHPRHDHGFTLPDPWLTVRHGIPNACNRCHTNQTADWSLQHVRSWYREERFTATRRRTGAVVAARAGEPDAWQALLECLQWETNAYWRAVLVQFLGPYAEHSPVQTALSQAVCEVSPLVRLGAVRALEQALDRRIPGTEALLRAALNDTTRSVRVAAAWALRASLEPGHPAEAELLDHLEYHADQPWGQFQLGLYSWDRQQPERARQALEQAVAWDPSSVAPRLALATVLSALGDPAAAVAHLEAAAERAPTNAEVHFRLGLAWNEAGNPARSLEALEKAVNLDPRHAAAWYNLGLARAAHGRIEAALQALLRAESLEPRNPRVPFARATVLARLGRWPETRAAAARARELGLDTPEVRALLRAGPDASRP